MENEINHISKIKNLENLIEYLANRIIHKTKLFKLRPYVHPDNLGFGGGVIEGLDDSLTAVKKLYELTVIEENRKDKKDSQVLAELKAWLEHLDTDDDVGHISMGNDIEYIALNDVINKIKGLQGES